MANKDWLKKGADGKSFGERLEDIIKETHITQSQIAKATGVKQSGISEYINGRNGGQTNRAPDCGTIIALAKLFSVSTDYLLGLTNTKSTNPNMQQAVEFTGLSQEAVEALRGWNWKVDLPMGSSVDFAQIGEKLAKIWSWLIANDNALPWSLVFVLYDLQSWTAEAHAAEVEFSNSEDLQNRYALGSYPRYATAKKEMDLLRLKAHEAVGRLWDQYINEYCSPWKEQPQKQEAIWEVIDDGND